MAKIKADSVLGKDELDMRGENPMPSDFYDIGKNIVAKLKKRGVDIPQIVTGGDTRANTPELIEALEKGIKVGDGAVLSSGHNMPKPLTYMAGEQFQANAISYVTGSHLTVQGNYNGIKINFLNQKPRITLSPSSSINLREEILEFYQNYLRQVFGSNMGGSKEVIVDSLYGTASYLAPVVFENLGFRVVGLHNYYDSGFTKLHNYSPDPHQIKNLEELMLLSQLLGVPGTSFDGDMDRFSIIAENGEKISEDEVTMIISDYLISNSKQEKPRVVYETRSSSAVDEVIKRAGGEPVIEKTGWQNIKRKMAEVKAIFGGEISGHNLYGKEVYYVPYGDDGLFTALMISKILIESGKPLSEIRDEFPVYFTGPELRMDYKEDRNPEIVKKLLGAFDSEGYQLKTISGDTRIEKKGDEWAWLVVRSSETQPKKLTVCFEGKTLDSMNNIFETFLDKIPEQDKELRNMVMDAYNSAVGNPKIFYKRALDKSGVNH